MPQPIRNNVVRCPKCGGLRLQVSYDDTANKSILKGAFCFGPLGALLNLFRNRHTARIYWKCETCGNVFPAEQQKEKGEK